MRRLRPFPPRPQRARWAPLALALALAFATFAVLVGGSAPAGARNPVPSGRGSATYRPPLVAPVADPFRAPPEPWLAGNRGIEYRTVAGSLVGAIGPGVVAFAGMVAGQRVVSIDHPDGLRSSYVDLSWIAVRAGDRVAAGQPVGRSTDRLHLGVRRDRAYLDPASLWGTSWGRGRAVLVPLDGGASGGPGRSTPPRPPAAPSDGSEDVGRSIPAVGALLARSPATRPP